MTVEEQIAQEQGYEMPKPVFKPGEVPLASMVQPPGKEQPKKKAKAKPADDPTPMPIQAPTPPGAMYEPDYGRIIEAEFTRRINLGNYEFAEMKIRYRVGKDDDSERMIQCGISFERAVRETLIPLMKPETAPVQASPEPAFKPGAQQQRSSSPEMESPAQRDFIRILSKQHHIPEPPVMTKAKAREWIDDAKSGRLGYA